MISKMLLVCIWEEMTGWIQIVECSWTVFQNFSLILNTVLRGLVVVDSTENCLRHFLLNKVSEGNQMLTLNYFFIRTW